MARTLVGLEIGSTAVRAAEVRAGARRGPVLRQGRVALPVGAVEAGVVRDPVAVTAAIRQLWSEHHFASRVVRLGVGSASVLVRQLDLDWMPEEDLRRSLRYQVADLLPVPIDDANIDHLPLGEHEVADEQGATRRVARILLVATARDAVDGLVRCVQGAKLRAVAADLSAFATVRAVVDPDAPPTGAPEALVDIGAQTVTVTVHADGRPEFVRVAPGNAGDMLTRALVEQLGATPVEAEELKRIPGVLPPIGQPPRRHEEAVLLDAVNRLIGEIRTTLEFHAVGHDAVAPVGLVLTGGGSRLPGLAEHCAAALQLPVRVPSETSDISVPYGLCLGLVA